MLTEIYGTYTRKNVLRIFLRAMKVCFISDIDCVPIKAFIHTVNINPHENKQKHLNDSTMFK